MIGRRAVAGVAGLLLAGSLAAAGGPAPYDYAARQRLVKETRQAGNYAASLYHSMWLVWLAPRQYREAAEPAQRDRDLRRRAYRDAGAEPLEQVIDAALQAGQAVDDSCLNGAIAQQAERLEDTIADLAQQAEAARARMRTDDPVARMALASLYLSWDDVLWFQQDPKRRRDRVRLLRNAASAAEAAAGAAPEAPGPYRTEAIVRFRLAEIDNDAEQWDAAIAAATRAAQLDSRDVSLYEFLWGLNLRAGRWEEARRWQERYQQGASRAPRVVAPREHTSQTSTSPVASNP